MTNPPQIPADDKDITLRLVLSHIQYHALRLDKRIDNEIGALRNELHDFKKEMRDFRGEFMAFARGVDDLDDRVQDIEDENLPVRMNIVEKKLSLAA